jgi:hypothetical protein
MKSIFLRLFSVAFLLLIATTVQAQADTVSLSVKNKRLETETHATLEKLMKYASERKYDSFGKLMAYTGRDADRNMRSPINPRDPHEKLAMENTCNYLSHWISKSALYHAENFRVMKGAAGDLIFWDAEFSLLNGKSKKFLMSFVEIQGKFYFCNVEKA